MLLNKDADDMVGGLKPIVFYSRGKPEVGGNTWVVEQRCLVKVGRWMMVMNWRWDVV